MNIVKLTSENVKRLTAVSITPQGNVIVIGGKNGQGKSSVLDSIQYALGGGTSDPMPVRRGEEKAKIVLDLGEIVVKRTFTAGGGTSLIVTNADGVKQSSPQAILDKLTGSLTFDPLEFSRQKPPIQAETLRKLVGIDFTQHDEDRAQTFFDRTTINREVTTLQAQIAGIVKHADAPEAEQSAADIVAEQQAAQTRNAENGRLRLATTATTSRLESAENALANFKYASEQTEAEITRLKKVMEAHKASIEAAKLAVETAQLMEDKAKAISEKLVDENISTFAVRLQAVEAINQKVRHNAKRAELVASLKLKQEKADDLTSTLEAFDSKKRRISTETKYPVDGLMFDSAGGVTMGGIPFQQCSQAEQLRVSVAIGLALNPTLKVLLVRDGSLLDSDSLALLCTMANDAKAQVWIERVGTDAQTSVIIEDGHIKEGELL